MLAWLFERKVFRPTISDPSTLFMKKKNTFYFFIKTLIMKGIPVEHLVMQNFIFSASIKYKFIYITFLTAEDKHI